MPRWTRLRRRYEHFKDLVFKDAYETMQLPISAVTAFTEHESLPPPYLNSSRGQIRRSYQPHLGDTAHHTRRTRRH
jgi:hypothetical protein